MQDSTFTDISFSDFSSFIFKVPVEKVVIDEEELEIDGILNLENLSRTCWNLKEVADVGEEARRFTSLQMSTL